MGNTLNSKSEMAQTVLSKMTTLRRSKMKSHNDDFIVQYVQNTQFEQHKLHNMDCNSLNIRRVVFVSLIGFYQTWERCPLHTLYSCLLLMPLKREWLYYPSQHEAEIASDIVSKMSLLSDIFADTIEAHQFIQLLKWKDSQGLVLWMLDANEYKSSPDPSSLVDPIWSHLSNKLMSLYDPITQSNYNGINLNEEWWQNKTKFISKYGVRAATVITELYFAGLKFKNIQELLYQSNPNSLIPLVSYLEHNVSESDNTKAKLDLYDELDDDEEIDDWWISNDYDPYDI